MVGLSTFHLLGRQYRAGKHNLDYEDDVRVRNILIPKLASY